MLQHGRFLIQGVLGVSETERKSRFYNVHTLSWRHIKVLYSLGTLSQTIVVGWMLLKRVLVLVLRYGCFHSPTFHKRAIFWASSPEKSIVIPAFRVFPGVLEFHEYIDMLYA